MVKAEEKVRQDDADLGPDMGWEGEGMAAMRQRRLPSLQIIYSILEQDPARNFFSVADECDTGLLARVPHASGMLDGTYTPGMVFDSSDHRSHRKQEWLESSLRKVSQLDFLYAQDSGRTIGQAAMQFALAQPTVPSVLPTCLTETHPKAFTDAPAPPPRSAN